LQKYSIWGKKMHGLLNWPNKRGQK
jgi:hypothetical protein